MITGTAYPAVLVGVPTRGLVDTDVTRAISDFATKLGTRPHYERGHLSAGMTRNRIVQRFLASGEDVLVMVDDDVAPNDQTHHMLERLDGWDVLAAAYPIFKPEMGWPVPVPPAYELVDGSFQIMSINSSRADDIVECDAVGTGCVAITRRAFDAIGRDPFAEAMNQDGLGIVSDDFVFCAKARAAGLRIGMDFAASCDHLVRVSLGAVLAGLNAYVNA